MNNAFGGLRRGIAVLAATLVVAISAPPLAAERFDVDLTGEWTLNEDLSDSGDVMGKVTDAMQEGRHGASRAGGHGPWMHGGGGMGARGGVDAARMRERLAPAVESPARRLTITQTDTSITIADSDGRSQTLTTDNQKQKLSLGEHIVKVRTRWYAGRLVKQMDLGDGVSVTETYALASEPRQLHVAVKLDGSHLSRPVNFRRVYDAGTAQ